jgi:hypothetical protein
MLKNGAKANQLHLRGPNVSMFGYRKTSADAEITGGGLLFPMSQECLTTGDKRMKRPQDILMLANGIRAVLPDGHASERRMFGGITFLVKGNMLCCVFKQGLMLRVGKDAEAAALSQPFVRRLSDTRKMPGFVFVEPEGIADAAELSYWISIARAYVDRLPPKTPKRSVERDAGRRDR